MNKFLELCGIADTEDNRDIVKRYFKDINKDQYSVPYSYQEILDIADNKKQVRAFHKNIPESAKLIIEVNDISIRSVMHEYKGMNNTF